MAWLTVASLGFPMLTVYLVLSRWKSGWAVPVAIVVAFVAGYVGTSLLAVLLNASDPVVFRSIDLAKEVILGTVYILLGIVAGAVLARKKRRLLRSRSSPFRKEQHNVGSASPMFMMALPDSDRNKPIDVVEFDGLTCLYYENPQTIGAVSGIASPYSYPQVAVIAQNGAPLAIFRVEQGMTGSAMLCSVGADGLHANFGPFTAVSRAQFIETVRGILCQQRMNRSNR